MRTHPECVLLRARSLRAAAVVLLLAAAACGDRTAGPGPSTVRPEDRLPGQAADPAAPAVPRKMFAARAEDYSDEHPTLRGAPLSFNTVLLALRPSATVGEVNALLDEARAEIAGGIPGVAGQTGGILFLRLPTRTHAELEAALERMRGRTTVAASVAPDALLAGNLIARPNGGTPAGWSWEATPAGGNWGLEISRVPQMWNLNAAVRKAHDSTVTGVFDAGFGNHAELIVDANLTPSAQSSHGTHVAGTIGARFGNGIGVDGVNPFTRLVLLGHTFTSSSAVPLVQATSMGEQMISVLDSLVRGRPDLRAINVSQGYNWASNFGVNTATSPSARAIVNAQGAIFQATLANLAAGGVRLPVIVVSAGNDSDAGFGDQEAKYASPMANAALAHDAAPVIVVEAIALGTAGSAVRAAYSNTGGHLSAPGSDVLSTSIPHSHGAESHPGDYSVESGTSMAAPHVTGLVSYLYSLDSTLPAPTLTSNPVRALLIANAIPVAGAAPRIDAFATAMDVDRVRGGTRVLRRLLDVDDGTLDGNQRTDPATGADFVGEDADADGGVGDGAIDMSDFRRWRDWLLEATNAFGAQLDGSAAHPKHDVNGDSIPGTLDENVYPRGDFNGDGILSEVAARAVPGAIANARLTDLQVLQQLFSDPNYAAADLPALVHSADLEIDPARCLALPGVASARSSIRVVGTPATTPLQQRTHAAADARRVYTAPVNPAGYTAVVEALDASGRVVGSAAQDFPFVLGSDSTYNPTCSAVELSVVFPALVTVGAPTPLDVRAGLRDVASGAVTFQAGIGISVVAAGGTVSPSSGVTDAQGRFIPNASLLAGSSLLTLTVTATAPSGATATRIVSATGAGPTLWTFDQSLEGWSASPSAVCGGTPPWGCAKWESNDGGRVRAAKLDGQDPDGDDVAANGSISRRVAVPAGMRVLRFDVSAHNFEGVDARLTVRIFANGTGSQGQVLLTEIISNPGNFEFNFSQRTIDISAFAGQTVTLIFEQDDNGNADGSYPGNGKQIWLDNISISP